MKKFIILFCFCIFFLPINAEAEDAAYELLLNQNTFLIEDGKISGDIEGFVIDKETGNISSALNGQRIIDPSSGLSVEIKGGYFTIPFMSVNPGKFELDIELSDLVKLSGSSLYLDINKNDKKDNDEYKIYANYYAVIPEIIIDQELEFQCGQSGPISITGTVNNFPEQDIGIRYKNESFLDTCQIRKNGTFSFLLNNKLDFDHGGEIEVVLELKDEPDSSSNVTSHYGVVVATGNINHLPLMSSISHSVIPEGTLNSSFIIRVNELPITYYDDDELEEDYIFETRLYDYKGEEITEVGKTDLLTKEAKSNKLIFKPFNKTALNKLEIGEYKISILLKKIIENDKVVDKEIYKASFDLNITSSNGDLLVGENLLSDRDCGTLTLDLGGENYITSLDDLIYYNDGKAVKTVKESKQIIGGYVLKYFAPGKRQKIVHTLYTDDDSKTVYPSDLPAGLSQSQFLGIDNSMINIPLYQGGKFNYILDVYEIINGNYRKTFTKNGSMKLNGYQVELSKKVIYPEEKVEQIITIKDQDGKEVNNAIIYYGKNIYGVNHPELNRQVSYALDEDGKYAGERGYLFKDSFSENIINGIYKVNEFTAEGSGYLNVVVYRLNDDNTVTRMAVIEEAILIKGKNSWNVELSEQSTRPGEEKTYYLNIHDGDGERIIPESIDILEDGVGWRTISSIEINANITNKGIKIVHTCRNETVGEIEFIPHNNYSTNTGSAIVEVIRPQLKFKNYEVPKITQDFISKLEFSVIDPKSGESIKEDIYYELIDCGSDAEGGLYSSIDGLTDKLDIITGDSNYKLYALIQNLNYEEINYAGVAPYLRLFMKSDDTNGDVILGDIPIQKAKLTISPSIISKDIKDIIITYTDAMGHPIKDKLIKVNYRKCGNTDNLGELHHYITTKGDIINILADTDVKYRFVELEIPIESETNISQSENKLVSAPEIVKQPRVTLRINHSEEIRYIRVNNKDEVYLKPVKFFMAKVDGLKAGNNEIRIDIFDKKGMSYTEIITVFYEEDFQPVVFKIGEKGKFGTPVFINGVTMVPVRFATELGAELKYDFNTYTVLYKRGNKEIKMTIGSSYAMVNGNLSKLQMAPYYNSEGRMMVPLRMVADELGFRVKWKGQFEPIEIRK